ncbi:MAG: hypothetical protein H7833_11735 [Magnetococcus sp. DMHC-1]
MRGRGSTTSESSATTIVSGSAVEGPIKGGSITVKNGEGSTIASATSKTLDDGTYSVTIPANQPLPWVIQVGTDGVDTTTGENIPYPLTTLVTSATQTTANISVMSTLLTTAAQNAQGKLSSVNAGNLATLAKSMTQNFGLNVDGEDSNLDIITSRITAKIAASFTKASEAEGELIRRTALSVNGTSNIEDFQTSLVRHLGTDLSDGKIDARKSVGGVVSDMTDAEAPQNKLAKLTGVVKTHEATVVLETATNQLAVTRKNGEEIPASTVKTTLASNMAAMVNRNEVTQTTPAEMLTRMADVPVSANLRAEGLVAVENVLLMDGANPRFLELQQAYTTNKIATGMKESAVAAALQIPDSDTTTSMLTQLRSEAKTVAASIMSSATNTDKLMTALRPPLTSSPSTTSGGSSTTSGGSSTTSGGSSTTSGGSSTTSGGSSTTSGGSSTTSGGSSTTSGGSSTTSGGSSTQILGTWYTQESAIVGSGIIPIHFAITLMSDGTYMHAEDESREKQGTTGMEYGTYTYNSSTGTLAASKVDTDTNGSLGLSNESLSISVDGNTMTVKSTSPNEPDAKLTRLVYDPNNPLVGSWYGANATKSDAVVITFLSNGTFVLGEKNTTDPSVKSGMEFGTYTWNSSTGIMTAKVMTDTNAEGGFSHPSGTAKITMQSGNNSIVLSDNAETHTATRVAPVP